MGNIIKINICTKFFSFLILTGRCNIWWKHNIRAFKPTCFWHHKLCKWWTVCATSFLFKDLQYKRVRCCFYCKIFTEPFIPWKCCFQPACIFTYSLFIIYMERRRICFTNLFYLFFSYKWYFLHCLYPSYVYN